MQPRRQRRRPHRSRARRQPRWGRVGILAGTVAVIIGGVLWWRHLPPSSVAGTGGTTPSSRGLTSEDTSAASLPASASSSNTTGAAPQITPLAPTWTDLPAGVRSPASGTQGPSGAIWVLTLKAGGGQELWRFHGTRASGHWAVPGAGAMTLQTVGNTYVWLGSATSEVAFSRTRHTFHTYGGAGTVAVQTVAGHSVALDMPQSRDGTPLAAPYVEVAPLGGSAHRVTLPGATAPTRAVGSVTAGPAGDALVTVAGTVWSVPVAGGSASVWTRLPAGAPAAPVAWGDGSLWILLGPRGAPTGIERLRPGRAPQPLGLATAHPPLAGVPLAFAGGDIWWATAHRLYGEAASGAAAVEATLPATGGGSILFADGNSVWIASGWGVATPHPPAMQG